MNEETAVTKCEPCVPATPSTNIEVTAVAPDEFGAAQEQLISWCDWKLSDCKKEHDELIAAYQHAVDSKWASGALGRQVKKAEQRVTFYEKMLTALKAGYCIVPNFPITAFAVRTDKERPLKMYSTSWRKNHTQEPTGLPEGEGEYKNPFPLVKQHTVEPATQTKDEVCGYWASAWKDFEFPITMAKPQIMEAVSRTMALKIFDDIGILPGYAPSEMTRPPKGDPIIVARLIDRSRCGPYNKHYVTFMVAWHLNTRDL